MFTLVYIKNKFNRPDNLLSFLEANTGLTTLLRVDCITPYLGSEKDLVDEICKYLSNINPSIKVSYVSTQNVSTKISMDNQLVNFLVMQIQITNQRD